MAEREEDLAAVGLKGAAKFLRLHPSTGAIGLKPTTHHAKVSPGSKKLAKKQQLPYSYVIVL